MNTTAFGILLLILVFPVTMVCQVSITCSSIPNYTQDFAFLGMTDYALTSNAPANLGWYATKSVGDANPNTFVANNGTAIIPAGLRNLGTTGDADRALGSVLGLPATGANNFLGLRIRNDCGLTATGIRVQYTGEQWSDTSGAPQTLTFSYQVSPSAITSLTAGTFNAFALLDFSSPNNANSNTALNGNLGGNRVILDQNISVTIPIGSEIMLRWADTNDPGGIEDSLGIDDVAVTLLIPTAAEISIDGRVITSKGSGISRATVVLSGNGDPKFTVTNTFGYYHFGGLLPGRTYVINVSAKKYQFVAPAQVISPFDDVANMDFIALPQ
jgi:hypothetical protein